MLKFCSTLAKNTFFLLSLTLTLLFSSCSQNIFLRSKSRSLAKTLINSTVLQQEFSGFVLYDLNEDKNIVDINGSKFFTPASNTKIFTFYASLMILKDSMPIIKYISKNDSLIFWGTGSPLCLNPDFEENTFVIDFLKKSDKKIYFCNNNFQDYRFGSGWAWDDYIYNYQLEKNAFPIYGNRLLINFYADSIDFSPKTFKIKPSLDSNVYHRAEFINEFEIGRFKSSKKIQIPFITDSTTITKLLSMAINKQVNKCPTENIKQEQSQILKIKIPDTLYLRLLHDSDNFIAEQLMQMCSFTLFDTLNTKKAIEYSKKNILPELKDKCRWVDGSGLSRYNLFSPNDLVYALKMIYNKLPWAKITRYFPAAGISGTLKENYPNIEKPFVYAKSGSLSNNYNLSGYIQTKKGNKYIFSFMNNHFLKKSKTIKKEIEKTLLLIYKNL